MHPAFTQVPAEFPGFDQGDPSPHRSGPVTVQASAQTQRVVVALDPAQISSDQVRAKLQRLGYAVEP
jgi:hypothetical protein